MTSPHPVYPGGPDCNPNCPGPETSYHEGYVDGFDAGEQFIASKVLTVLPLPTVPVPTWVFGPTRRKWTSAGIRVAVKTLGFHTR